MNCPHCAGTGWIEQPGGMARCECRKNATAPRQPLNQREIAALAIAATKASQELGNMADYPHALDPLARQAVADALSRMCWSPEQVQWVRRRATLLFRNWKHCGEAGLRQIVASKFRPRDGIESGPMAISEGYPEGLPDEKENLTGYQIAEGQRRRELTEPATKDHLLGSSIKKLAASQGLPTPAYALPPEQRKLPPVPQLPPPAPPPIPDGKQITAADIEAELRKKSAQGGTSTTAPSEPAPAPDGGGVAAAAIKKDFLT
jgi:hypothetical protein